MQDNGSPLGYLADLQPIIHGYLEELEQKGSRTNENALLARIVDQGGIAVYKQDPEVYVFSIFSVQRSALCRSGREFSNACLLAKFGFDTAENEPSKVCRIP